MKPGEKVWVNIYAGENDRNGVLTIGAMLDRQGIYVTYAACSPKDRFSKKKASMIVSGRLAIAVQNRESPCFAGRGALVCGNDSALMPENSKAWFIPFENKIEVEYRSEVLYQAVKLIHDKMAKDEFTLGWFRRSSLIGRNTPGILFYGMGKILRRHEDSFK